jgi:hypothetical protein
MNHVGIFWYIWNKLLFFVNIPVLFMTLIFNRSLNNKQNIAYLTFLTFFGFQDSTLKIIFTNIRKLFSSQSVGMGLLRPPIIP